MSTTVKSDLITEKDAIFKMEGIVIAFPQHDLYIHATPATDAPPVTGI